MESAPIAVITNIKGGPTIDLPSITLQKIVGSKDEIILKNYAENLLKTFMLELNNHELKGHINHFFRLYLTQKMGIPLIAQSDVASATGAYLVDNDTQGYDHNLISSTGAQSVLYFDIMDYGITGDEKGSWYFFNFKLNLVELETNDTLLNRTISGKKIISSSGVCDLNYLTKNPGNGYREAISALLPEIIPSLFKDLVKL